MLILTCPIMAKYGKILKNHFFHFVSNETYLYFCPTMYKYGGLLCLTTWNHRKKYPPEEPLLGYCLQNFFENMDLDIDVIYLKNPDAMKDYLAKTLKALDTAHVQFSRIYRLNRDGVFMDLLRSLLIQVLTDKLKQAEKSGIHCRISTPVFTYLLADFYISVAKCYLDFDGEFSAEDFVEHVVLFANRNFFE